MKDYFATKTMQEETNAFLSEINEKVLPQDMSNITILTVDFLDASSLTITSGYLDTDAREIRTR